MIEAKQGQEYTSMIKNRAISVWLSQRTVVIPPKGENSNIKEVLYDRESVSFLDEKRIPLITVETKHYKDTNKTERSIEVIAVPDNGLFPCTGVIVQYQEADGLARILPQGINNLSKEELLNLGHYQLNQNQIPEEIDFAQTVNLFMEQIRKAKKDNPRLVQSRSNRDGSTIVSLKK